MAAPSTSRRAGLALASLVSGYFLLDLVAGAPDSPLVPRLPAGVRPPGWTTTGARWIGLDRLTRTGLTLLSIALLAGLLAAFLLLVVEASRGRVRATVVLVAAGVSLALSVAAPVLLSRDVYSYAVYGRMYAIHHSNPYVRPPSAFPDDPFVAVASPAWIETRSVYGPAFVLTGAAVARAWAGSPAATILAFKALAGLGAALAALLAALAARPGGRRDLARPGGRRDPPPPGEPRSDRMALAAAAVGLNPVIVVHTVGGGHSDALIAACLAGALVLALRWARGRAGGRAGPAALAVTALLTLAVLIKVVLAPVLLVWLWCLLRAPPREHLATRAAVHGGAVVGLALAFSAPFVEGRRALASLLTLTSVEGWASGARLVARGVRALGDGTGGAGTADVLAKIVVVGFLGVFAAGIVRLLRGPSIERPADAWGVSILGLVLAIPYLAPWYAAWFLPFLALLSDRGLAVIGFASAGLLALTGVPAEPGSAPGLWRDMILGVHYGAAPIMLGMFLVWAVRVLEVRPPGTGEAGPVRRMADRARP
jgi:alpha-1,6-mannosyltransferase